MTPRSRTLLRRAIRMYREYQAGFRATGDIKTAWGLADAMYEIELLMGAD